MRATLLQGAVLIGCLTALGLSPLAGQGQDHHPTPSSGDTTPLYHNLGSLHHPITTRSPMAQKYFDQGLRLTYGFNHDEAIKSYTEAIRHDSTCAMCYWGIAYALGPNINLPMDTSLVKPAWEAVQNARKYSAGATPKEQAYIRALAQRYAPRPSGSRAALDSAWSNAIGEVARRFPKDDDAVTLYGESLMDLRPWNYWTNGGEAKAPSTRTQLALLERVVNRSPNHPGACHFYIHAIEASPEAAKALPCARRLGSLMPGAGHLVHMPTHIYIKLGQWDLAAEHNVHAVHADESFINERHPTGVYPIAYYPHNYHVLWYALNMLGRSEASIEAARQIVAKVPAEVVRQVPPLEYFSPSLLFSLARFSKWDEILRQPAPPAHLRYTSGIWHYARGLAHTARGRLDSAALALDSVEAIAAAVPAEQTANLNSVKALLGIAGNHLAGEIAAKRGRTDLAVDQLQKAIALEDELIYDEPPAWYLPMRQALGRVLLAGGRAAGAEKAFREDLVRRPNNGWSLHGLAQSLRAQNRAREAAEAEGRFKKAWRQADFELAAR